MSTLSKKAPSSTERRKKNPSTRKVAEPTQRNLVQKQRVGPKGKKGGNRRRQKPNTTTPSRNWTLRNVTYATERKNRSSLVSGRSERRAIVSVAPTKCSEEQTTTTTLSLQDSHGSANSNKLIVLPPLAGETSCDDDDDHHPETTRDSKQEMGHWREPQPILQHRHRPVGSMTFPTLCSALERLSFDNLCGGDIGDDTDRGFTMKSLSENVLFNLRSEKAECSSIVLDVVDNIIEPDGIPREISFERKVSRRPRPSRSFINREEIDVMDSDQPPAAVSFFRTVLRYKSVGRKSAPKVKIYCEKPVPMEYTNSVANSTITWPAEFRKDGTPLNVSDETQL